MKAILAVLGIILQIFGAHSLIIPDEIPSLLSVIYSNIPTIKKGTDSRFGWGFRFGDRADFQVLVELGPQTNTQPLANQGDGASTSKRNVANNLRNTVYAQQKEREKQISDTEGGKWIDQWRENMKDTPQTQPLPVGTKPGLGIGEIDAKSVIPDDATLMLKELYGTKATQEIISSDDVPSGGGLIAPGPTSIMLDTLYGKKSEKDQKEVVEEVKRTTQKPKTTTSFKEALDNVDMDKRK